MNNWNIRDTISLIQIVERIKPAAGWLVDSFFPNVMPTERGDYVPIEFRKSGRKLAPYIVPGSKGVNVARDGSRIQMYKAPLLAPRRVIGLEDISQRVFGEQPAYSSLTEQDRAQRILAQDLIDLMNMNQNRRNQQAAEIIQTGKVTVRGYADDAKTVVEDTIGYDWDGLYKPVKAWSDATADIYGDLLAASELIQENSGIVPTLMVCGKNVAGYLFKNASLKDWMMIPNRETAAMLSFSPYYQSPQVRPIGRLNALNLDIVAYTETYTDDVTGEIKPFIDADSCIIGIPGKGKQLYGAVTLLEGQNWITYSAPDVPYYAASYESQQTSLTLYSRSLLVPETTDDFICIKTTTTKNSALTSLPTL